VLGTALIALLALGQPPRPFAEERQLLDRRLEALRRILPDGPSAAADAALAREAADSVRLARVGVQARPPVESGRRGEVVLDFAALGGYGQINGFFRKLETSPRLVDVESLTLTATAEDLIRLTAVLRLPYWPPKAPLPAAPEAAPGRTVVGVPRPTADAFLRDQALAFAKSELIAERRRTRRTPRLFLAELSAACRERPLVVGYASLGEEFTVRGTVLGQAALRDFENRLERGFFRVSEFLIAKQGACHRFEAHGRSPVVGGEAALPLAGDDPFDDTAPCRADRDAPAGRPLLVKGRTPTPKQPGKGPLTLRLRDVDLADVFHTLARLGLGGWLVDEAVTGRTSVELVRATLDEALAALRGSARLDTAEAAAVRRVSLAQSGSRASRPAARREPAGGGPPAVFWLKRAEVRDLLAAGAELDPSLASLGPPGFLGRVSVFTRDAPLLAVRAAVLEAASLTERTEQDRRVLERKTGANESPVPVARSAPEPRLALRPEELSLDEFELAGVGSAGQGFLAFVYAPTGQLYAYAAGDRLADAIVRSVDADGVTLETEEGPLQLSVPPLPN